MAFVRHRTCTDEFPEDVMMSRCSSVFMMGFALAAAACTDSADDPTMSGLAASAWESAVTTTDDGAIVIQKVTYRSQGMKIVGQVCRPTGAGPFPLIVENHGGVSGLPGWNGGSCAAAARAGFIQIESSFRGQDGSDGFVELCAGEVDDALSMLEIARTMPEVDQNRVVMWGTSLGGCVTTRALQRGAKVKAAASVFGITDMRAEYEFWRTQVAIGAGPTVQYQQLIDVANAGIGGSPADYPEEYQLRSPIEHLADLPAGVPFLMAHGVEDQLVPPSQSCDLAHRLTVSGHHYDEQHQLLATTPAGCESMWTATTAPVAGWPATRYLLVYDGAHTLGVNGANATAMDTDLQSFLTTQMR
jgi:dienelactone hydrolase